MKNCLNRKSICKSIFHSMIFCSILSATTAGFATTYYVDPAKGDKLNPGTAAAPWKTLQQVFEEKEILQPGDVLFLLPGDHGTPNVTGLNTGIVEIKGDIAKPAILKGLVVSNASNWKFSSLFISPHPGLRSIVSLAETANSITIEGCKIYSTLGSVATWTGKQWTAGARGGVVVEGDYNVIRNNHILNVITGLRTAAHANRNIIQGNTVENFAHDGMMETGDYNTFQGNRIINAFQIDGNHPDGLQAFGHGNMTGTIIRDNYISGYENHPNPALYTGTLQGIGLFSTYKNYIVEGNTVSVDHGIGVWILGSTGGIIRNNTVVRNGHHAFTSGKIRPGIRLFFIDRFGKVSRNSINNIVQNNSAYDFALKNKDGSLVCAKAADCTGNVLKKWTFKD